MISVGDEWWLMLYIDRVAVEARLADVTKITRKRIYFGGEWFSRVDPERNIRPKLVGYEKRAEPMAGMAEEGGG